MGEDEDFGGSTNNLSLDDMLGLVSRISPRTQVTITASHEKSQTYTTKGPKDTKLALASFLGVLGFYDEKKSKFEVERSRSRRRPGGRYNHNIKVRCTESGNLVQTEGYGLEITYKTRAA